MTLGHHSKVCRLGAQYLGAPPGDPHVQSIVTAGFRVGQGPTLLIGLQEGLILLRQDVSNDHGGASSQSCLLVHTDRGHAH